MSPAKVELGRRLFYDVRLSGNGTQACSSCHQQKLAFTDGRAHALGSTGESHPRSAMSLVNAAYGVSLTWVGTDHQTLEDQMLVPLLADHPVEMGLKGREDEALQRLREDPLYSKLFSDAFPSGGEAVSLWNIRRAIAAFERTIIAADSSYDRLVWNDERGALSEPARRGMTLFFSERLACSKCHAGFTFSGPAAWEGAKVPAPRLEDNGLGGRFRVPTLRNVAVTSPYMHDGRFASLEDVVDHYAGGGTPSPGRSPLVRGFVVTNEEKRDLVEFLKCLTDDRLLADPAFADPWK
jgi:cytochrome c peroxidase